MYFHTDSRVRVATLEMSILVLKQLIGIGWSGHRRRTSCLRDHHLATLEGAREEATLMLRTFYKVNCASTFMHSVKVTCSLVYRGTNTLSGEILGRLRYQKSRCCDVTQKS